jgi:DNA (cytosine-5)-methyltransferase 1
MKSIELFVGAGGLALGTASAGFKHVGVFEWDKYACDTIRENAANKLEPVVAWPLFQGDVRGVDFRCFEDRIDLVSGGPPCQPFSLGGKHRGRLDDRDMFPQAVRAVREIRPKAFIIENVRGLTRPVFYNYFQYIRLQFEFPEIELRDNEEWQDHLSRLEKHKTRGKIRGLRYNVVSEVLNAADYGVPQRRERVFIVGFRDDLGIDWSFPEATHSREALRRSQSRGGDYWNRHCISARKLPAWARSALLGTAVNQTTIEAVDCKSWVTTRDAITGLPRPAKYPASEVANHRLQLGSRAYAGHTGSPLDLPAKTLKAGDHGVPGGENMLILDDGSVRYFTVRESARLQTFPDDFVFHGTWTETMRQLGNAVPVRLAAAVVGSVSESLRKCGR